MLFLISVIHKSSKNLRGLFLYRLAALMLFVGGNLGLLHGFQNIELVHRNSYAVFYYGLMLKQMAFGMMLALAFLGVSKEFESRQKNPQP